MTAIGPGMLVKCIKDIWGPDQTGRPPEVGPKVGSIWTVEKCLRYGETYTNASVLHRAYNDYLFLKRWPEPRAFVAEFFAPFEPEADAFRERARKAPAPIDG